jgi:hypothetical protein
MLKLMDVRMTTRRAAHGDARTVYPRLLRDRSLAPRIELAVRHLEGLVGRERRALDQEVIVQLFGDHKIARGIVASLAASYRYQPRTFADVLPPERVVALAERDLRTPAELRLWLFRRANDGYPGFVGGAERAPFLRATGDELGLTPTQVEELAALDQPAHAILVRSGPVPTADDVIARFNFLTVAALLASAPLVRLSLRQAPAHPDHVRELLALADVQGELMGRELLLHGRQDALGGWSRHGAQLVRVLTALLAAALPAQAGEAVIAASSGAEWRFRLDSEILGYLGQPGDGTLALCDLATLLEHWRQAEAFAAAMAALRRMGQHHDWTLRRATEPLVLATGVLPVLFVAVRGTQRVAFVPMATSAPGALRLAEAATRYPLVAFAGTQPDPAVVEALAQRGRPLVPWYTSRSDVAGLPALLDRAVDAQHLSADPARLRALAARAAQSGLLPEQEVAPWLECAEDEVWVRLSSPEAQELWQRHGLRYVEGFGLCATRLLADAEAAMAEISQQAALHQAERGRIVSQLGRRLRELTGTSQGIECLIAYLGAA